MKYQTGTLMIANMVKSALPDDTVTAEILGFDSAKNQYTVRISFNLEIRYNENRIQHNHEDTIDDWLSKGWKIIPNPNINHLPNELFTL